jgi:uncharacterized SAM-binding protein YcdF (DUF218 family)
MTRLVAVLGYSDSRAGAELHPVCEARVARAAEEATADDVVLFSGWARNGSASSEADLMAASWLGAKRRHLVDRRARTTLGNAISVGQAARRVDATEVLLVTSSWHARRASVLVRAALLGSGTTLQVAATAHGTAPARRLRELAAWTVVPVLAVVAARTR